MADIITINPEEKDIRKIVFAVRQLAERFQPSEDTSSGSLQAANNLSDVANVETAVSNLGLLATVTEVGDTDHTIDPTEWTIVTNTTLTSPRTWTLPAASAVPAYHPIHVFDRGNAGLGANSLIIARAGSDTIAGLTSITLNVSRTGARFVSDGVSKWTIERLVFGANQFLDQLTTTRGSLLYRGASAWAGLAPNTAGYVLTDSGAGADPAWAALPTPSVAVLQVLQNTYTTNANLTAQIPQDDTTPGSSEGTEVLSQAITPADNTNKVLVIVHLWGSASSGSNPIIASVFRGTTCIQVVSTYCETANFQKCISCAFLDSPASASAQTYSVRVGPAAAITVRLNGSSSARLFGGTASASLTVMEIAA